MADVMVDTSAWIQYFRRGEGAVSDAIEGLLDENRVVLCGMVELELLRGVRPHERKMLRDLLGALDYAETMREDFAEAGGRLCRLRQKGITIPASDGLIAAVCFRLNLHLLTLDLHFDHLPEVKRLKFKSG
jgi:predicted nucleic acid-binding protein